MSVAEYVKREAAITKKMAEECKKLTSPGTGFLVMTFDFGPGGRMNYASNGTRADVIKMLREFLSLVERDGVGE